MPRHAKLRKKKIGTSTYWFTKAGGDTYFGRVDDVSYKEARRLFRQHVGSVMDDQKNSKGHELTAGELMDLFLDWIANHRSDRTSSTRRTHCNRFGKFRVKDVKIGDQPARKIRASDLEAWLEHLESEGHAPQTRRHAQTSIKHCWNWATKHCPPGSNTPYLPPTFRPFASVEPVFVPPKALTEADLITDEEIKALFAAAELDLDMFHRFAPKTPRTPDDNPYRSFAAMLRCYHATGARTDELAQCRVGDVLLQTKQVRRGKGIGLANTRERLQQLYGDDHFFEIRNDPTGGAVVTIEVPYRESPSGAGLSKREVVVEGSNSGAGLLPSRALSPRTQPAG